MEFQLAPISHSTVNVEPVNQANSVIFSPFAGPVILSSLKNASQELQKQTQTMADELQENQRMLETTIPKLEQKLGDLKAALELAKGERKNLEIGHQTLVNSLLKHIETLNTALSNAKARRDQLEAEFDSLTQTIAHLNSPAFNQFEMHKYYTDLGW